MMLYLTTVLAVLAGVQAKFFTDCGSKLATVQLVGVSGCGDDASECVLKRNSNATISIDLTPSQTVSSVEAVVHGVIMDLPVPFPLPQPDACRDHGLTCPLPAGQKVAYRATLPVLKSYPKVKVDVKWELKTESDEDLVCILIKAKIH